MKSIIKKVAVALLVVPLLALGVGLLGATPALAKKCGNDYKGCYVETNGTYTYYNKDGNPVTKDAYCGDPTLGLSAGIECGQGNDQPDKLFGDGGIITTIINVMLFLIGILCVVMIIFGGIRYTTSTGEKGRIDSAKNTIIYAIVGLVVAIVAYALVNWVFVAITGN
jgi:hypothetical protein